MPLQKRILIAPLNWGLGHATRCVPIIRLLIEKQHTVIITAEGRALEFLKQEFPELEFISLKGIAIEYPRKGSMALKMLVSLPKIMWGIYREHRLLKKIIAEKNIDVVISDNRFGIWNKKVKSIFITHQLMIKSPFAERLLHQLNLFFIKQYDECWIPDTTGLNNLSGDLSHKYPLPKNAFFIGHLSRFNSTTCIPEPVYDVMAIVSGPEPQRSVFENILIEQLEQSRLKAILVCGKTEAPQKRETKKNLEIISHLNTNEMQEAILKSKIIISRSGYSTLMDLAVLGKKAIFVPTPGQTEQEYLAEMLMQKKRSYFIKQSEFDLQKVLNHAEQYLGLQETENTNEIKNRIAAL